MPPSGLIQSLQAVRRKVKVLSVTFGAGVATAAFVGLLLATLLIDYTLRLDWEPRLIVVLAAIGGAVYSIIHWIVIPWRSSLHVGAVAGRIEHTFPQFDDRLRSTVDFTNGQIPGSQAMQDRVIAETAELARNVNFNKAIARGPVYWSLTGGLASLT